MYAARYAARLADPAPVIQGSNQVRGTEGGYLVC